MEMISPITDSIFEKLNDKELLLINELYTQYKNEIARLNKIIDELEKYISQEWYCFDNESDEFKVAKDILCKLKELKEEGK